MSIETFTQTNSSLFPLPIFNNEFSVIAWGLIPLDVSYTTDSFYFHSWNLFVAISALPSLMIGLWLFVFPESPKFLLECGEYEAALKVFKHIYAMNTGNDPETYPVKSLQEKPNAPEKSPRKLKLLKRKDLKVLFSEVWDMTKALCRPPYRRNTILSCAIQFGLTSSYYTLMVWFPELFTRYDIRSCDHYVTCSIECLF